MSDLRDGSIAIDTSRLWVSEVFTMLKGVSFALRTQSFRTRSRARRAIWLSTSISPAKKRFSDVARYFSIENVGIHTQLIGIHKSRRRLITSKSTVSLLRIGNAITASISRLLKRSSACSHCSYVLFQWMWL
uniref:AlNc14C296G10311 protein n=1 Tax=Albugo laibachii Nc14 TaxID=890382 RepID=F0WVH6_9STRA|nr:AlNc14C296G10311 [Albugo laibachii Nc14]|eukprot:CCA25417.1 AlNc14C296G10311 [Albugo laibachii Nc14]